MLYRAKTRRRGAELYMGLVYKKTRSTERFFYFLGGEAHGP